jgi:hypothetical protein
MNLLNIATFICLSFVAIVAHASYGPPKPFFEIPSYIDPDYKAPNYAEIGYGQKTKFGIVLQQYESSEASQEDADDSSARAASERQEAKNYAKYVEGAKRFHAQAYEDALKIFTELRNNQGSLKERLSGLLKEKNYSWVREASTYMIARCQLIMAQKNWDGYSDPTKDVDQSTLHSSDTSYQLYLKEYPQGLYANSARNIRRKIFYLSGNQAELDRELKNAMLKVFPISSDSKVPHNANLNIVGEFENYFHGEIDTAHDSPMVIAYVWLGDKQLKIDDIKLLEDREKDFFAYPNLFRYLHALGLYRLGQYKEIITKIPEQPLTKNTLSLSTQLLLSRALSQLGKTDEALTALEKMHAISSENAVELEIAYLKLNSGYGLWLYTNQSPLKTEKILRSLAQFGLTDNELEKGMSSNEIKGDKRKFLVDELARRYVLSKRFKELSALLMKEQGTGIFAPLKSISALLAKNANNEQALVDVGEFIYQHYITPTATFEGYDSNRWAGDALTDLSLRCKPCQAFKERSESYAPPITFFRSVTENAKRSGAKSEAEAKALHYITRCMRQGGEFEDRCNWQKTWDTPSDSSSKAAFMRLHKLYKDSSWAAKTPYFY